MQIHSVHKFAPEALDTLVGSLGFFKTVRQRYLAQYHTLLQYSEVREYRLGEVVIPAGTACSRLHCVIKGQLAVYAAGVGPASLRRVALVAPGEVLGDVAVLLGVRRSAEVICASRARPSQTFSTDLKVFGELRDFTRISLPVKLLYYRQMVHNLRWRLETNRTRYPGCEGAALHRRIPVYQGPRDGMAELVSLDAQARALVQQLIKWDLEYLGGETSAPAPRVPTGEPLPLS